jgi:hypothetical protein
MERHYLELTNVPSLALVNCANMALPNRILPFAMFTLHTLPEDVSAYHLRVAQGGPHEAYVGCELMVKVALGLCLLVFVRPGSHL